MLASVDTVQLLLQSESLPFVHPYGQHMSDDVRLQLAVPATHCAWQVLGFCSVSVVHGWVLGAQLVGQAPGLPAVMPVSHSSPGSTMPLPQIGWQSTSVLALQPDGQQPSLVNEQVAATCVQWVWQPVPVTLSTVQALPSLQSVLDDGQCPGRPAPMAVSQNSPLSTTPLPQTGEQSTSLFALQPGGQQLLAVVEQVMSCVCTQCC